MAFAPTEVKNELNWSAKNDVSVVYCKCRFGLLGRARRITFQIEPLLPLFERTSLLKYFISAFRIACFVSCLEILNDSQSSGDLVCRALLCSRFLTRISCLMSFVMNGFGLCLIVMVFIGA